MSNTNVKMNSETEQDKSAEISWEIKEDNSVAIGLKTEQDKPAEVSRGIKEDNPVAIGLETKQDKPAEKVWGAKEDHAFRIRLKILQDNSIGTSSRWDVPISQKTDKCTEKLPLKCKSSYKKGEKVILDELGETSCDDNLPEGWVKIYHESGMPVYLEKETRVCTFTKPYFLGVNSLKNHEIPVENVICLNYKKKLEKLNNKESDEDLKECPATLKHEEYREYCSKVFKFKNIKFMRFSSWDKRREYIRMIKAERRRKDLPKLKDKSHLITFPVQQTAGKNKNNQSGEIDQWVINLNGKSYVSILHEYIQRVLKTQPSYEFKELENARFPYLATVILDGMQYGVGIGSSKKQAKVDSARATLEILLPSVKDHIQINRRHATVEHQGSSTFKGDSLFDDLKIKDSRIPEFCAQAAEKMPYDILNMCVKRNFGEDAEINCTMQRMQSGFESKIFYRCTMAVKEHSATVICKNKREGRQKGAQALLQVLHPHITLFGSLLRLYSHQDYGSSYEKKLDDPGTRSPKLTKTLPNRDILRQLREEIAILETK